MQKCVHFFFIFFVSLVIFWSCRTLPKEAEEGGKAEKTDEILLLFAGDVMAHKPNYSMKDFKAIWEDVKPIIEKADLAFANIEAPVDDDLDFSTYPNFNMKNAYAAEIVNAGFDVFLLVNNHTNDQGLDGMKATDEWSKNLSKKTAESENPLYFSGLKEKKDDEFSYCIIKKRDWTILFLAITEILNRNDYKNLMNYVPYTKKGRADFLEYAKKMRAENECDLFIVSIHTDEEEYKNEVFDVRKKYYYELLDGGVDVLWTNHPHIIREREIVKDEQGKLKKVIMYGNGNTISGQRWSPDFKNPENPRDKTGDGLMLEVVFEKKLDENGYESEKNVFIKEATPYFITTYIDEKGNYLIKRLDENFADELEKNGNKKWATYIRKRLEIVK